MRLYAVTFDNVAATAVQDLISVTATANMAIRIHEAAVGQIDLTTVSSLRVALRRLPATVTAGTGGNAFTPVKLQNGDAAATATARINDTGVATTSGSATVIVADTFNVLNGFLWLPAPEDRIIIAPSQALVFSLLTAPTSCHISGRVIFEELF